MKTEEKKEKYVRDCFEALRNAAEFSVYNIEWYGENALTGDVCVAHTSEVDVVDGRELGYTVAEVYYHSATGEFDCTTMYYSSGADDSFVNDVSDEFLSDAKTIVSRILDARVAVDNLKEEEEEE